MAASLVQGVGPAVSLGLDSGLPDEDEFAQLLDVISMTADPTVFWQAQDAHSSGFGTPLEYYYSAAASNWARSPGKQSQQNSNAAALSSLSPTTGSLILTPTSSNPLEFFGDATQLEDAEASDNISTSPESSFSPSSDDFVDLGRVPGHPRGRRNMNIRPQLGSNSRVAPASSHPPATTSAVIAVTGARSQWSSLASTSSTGGWMDPSGGQWGHFDPSAFNYNLNSPVTSQSFDSDPLSDISAFTGVSSRGFDANAPFRPVDNSGQILLHGSYESNYPFAPQVSQQQLATISPGAQVLPGQRHAFAGALPVGSAQPDLHRLNFPPTVPSQYDEIAPQGSGRNVPRMHDARSANTSVASSPTFASGLAVRPSRHAPYPQPVARHNESAQSSHAQHHTHLAVPPSSAMTAANRQLQPLVPGSSRATAGSSSHVDRAHRGGRKKNMRLADGIRQKSHMMRKAVACWRCALQRDPCPDEGTPCNRCHMRSQKGQQYYFACDRSKLPDFAHDFLPPSMTGMHQKQSIEDYVADKVARWDRTNSMDIWLTCGYGPGLHWKLYEFDPKDDEPCWQLQYLQDPNTRKQIPYKKYSPPFGLMKLDTSDEEHFEGYMEQLLHRKYLWEFGWTCFEEETQVDDFQARLLQAMCELHTNTDDSDLRDLLRKILRMMVITYIMGHTLTLSEDTAYGVLNAVKMSPTPAEMPTQHVSPRLANRQLKFFFHILREKVYLELLNWQQQTLRSSPKKEATWLPAFCVTLGIAMVLEEVQRTIWIQADAKSRTDSNTTLEQANTEAANACERIDDRYKLLVGLFQCKYRDKRWGFGSFGHQTPELTDPHSNAFLAEVLSLLVEKQEHLESRIGVPLSSDNQCFYTSRLVARFLLPFLNLPP